jgi:trk system potassium uptake protein TrkH
LFPLYVLMITGGYFALRAEGSMVRGNELNVDRALFASINAATLTGFQQAVGLSQYLEPARYTILCLMIGGTFLSLVIGALAVVRIARLGYSDRQVVLAAVVYSGIAIAIGAGLLATPGRSIFDAVFLAVSAFGNCGLSTGQLPGMTGWQTHVVLIPLAVLGSLGLPVLMEVKDLLRGRIGQLSTYSRTVLGMSAGLYLVFLLLFAGLQWQASAAGMGRNILAHASVEAINSRTAGLGFSYAYSFPRAMQWGLILAMLIGGSPAGTAGGIKTTALAELFNGTRRIFRGEAPGRSFALCLMWIGMYVGVIVVAVLIVVSTDPQAPGDQVLFEVVSAVGNVGLSYDPVSIVGPGLFTLAAAMFMGRMLSLLVLWWQADTAIDADLPIS